jgi:hypothetical protein
MREKHHGAPAIEDARSKQMSEYCTKLGFLGATPASRLPSLGKSASLVRRQRRKGADCIVLRIQPAVSGEDLSDGRGRRNVFEAQPA